MEFFKTDNKRVIIVKRKWEEKIKWRKILRNEIAADIRSEEKTFLKSEELRNKKGRKSDGNYKEIQENRAELAESEQNSGAIG